MLSCNDNSPFCRVDLLYLAEHLKLGAILTLHV